MKKLLGILVLGLFFISSPAKADVYGKGELKLGGASVNNFIKYLKGGWGNKPMAFLVTLDGWDSYYWYCPEQECRGNWIQYIQTCEDYYNGKECKIFARGRTVKWKNGINTGRKASKFNSKWSDSEIRAKLTELGFLGGTTSTTTYIEKKESKIKKKPKKKMNDDIVQQLKDLNELYESGVLTKEEFEKAKKKLLN